MKTMHNIFTAITVCLWFMVTFVGFPIIFVGTIVEIIPLIYLWYWFVTVTVLTGICALDHLYRGCSQS